MPTASAFLSDAYVSQARQLAEQVQTLNEQLKKIRTDLAKRSAEADALAKEKASALAEMRQGLFCSGCGQTRSQILAKGEQFPHAGQHIVAGTQQQIDAKAQEFDSRIAGLRQEAKNLAKQADQLEFQRQQIVTDQLPRAVIGWKNAVNADEEEIRATWEHESKRLQAQIDQLTRQLSAATTPAAVEQLMSSYNALKREYEEAENASRRQADLLDAGKKTGLAEMSDALSKAGAQAMIPPTYMLPSFSLNTKITPFQLKVSPDALVVTATFNKALKGVFEVRNDFFKDSMSVKMGLETFGGFSGGMERTTTWGPNGVTTTDAPYGKTPFSSSPQKPER